MNEPLFFKLDQDPRGDGLRCDEQGLFLAGEPLLERNDQGQFHPRPHRVLIKALGVSFNSETDVSSRIRSVSVIANSLNEGNLAHAMMAAVLMKIPDRGGTIRTAAVDGILEKANFNSNEARDYHGRWSNGGGVANSTQAFA